MTPQRNSSTKASAPKTPIDYNSPGGMTVYSWDSSKTAHNGVTQTPVYAAGKLYPDLEDSSFDSVRSPTTERTEWSLKKRAKDSAAKKKRSAADALSLDPIARAKTVSSNNKKGQCFNQMVFNPKGS